MNRRTFLVALTPFAAGCFGGQRSQSNATTTDESSSGATSSTPTTTAQSAASQAAAQHISDAQGQLTEAVYLYTGGVSNDLTSVTADAESFRAREVLLRLDGIGRALVEAESEAPTAEQRDTIDALDRLQRFLTLATDAQSWLIDGHDALTAAVTHLDGGDRDAAEDDVDRVETAVEEVAEPTTTIRETMGTADTSVLDAIDEDEYGAKVTQLAAEADVFTALGESVVDIDSGISMVNRARTEVEDDRTERAADTADRAYETLSDVEDRLDDLLDDLPDHAAAFETVTEDMRYLAARHADDADAIYEKHS